MSELMFQVRNSYSADSGDPSIVDGNDPKKYVGYFQSPDGHQLVFIFDRKTKNAELRCGDCGWNVIIEVIDAVPVGLEMWFGNAERLWLCACWMSANKQESVPSACGPRIRMM